MSQHEQSTGRAGRRAVPSASPRGQFAPPALRASGRACSSGRGGVDGALTNSGGLDEPIALIEAAPLAPRRGGGLGVSAATLRRWVRLGSLRAWRGPNGLLVTTRRCLSDAFSTEIAAPADAGAAEICRALDLAVGRARPTARRVIGLKRSSPAGATGARTAVRRQRPTSGANGAGSGGRER